jgi:hypothetical protein
MQPSFHLATRITMRGSMSPLPNTSQQFGPKLRANLSCTLKGNAINLTFLDSPFVQKVAMLAYTNYTFDILPIRLVMFQISATLITLYPPIIGEICTSNRCISS